MYFVTFYSVIKDPVKWAAMTTISVIAVKVKSNLTLEHLVRFTSIWGVAEKKMKQAFTLVSKLIAQI